MNIEKTHFTPSKIVEKNLKFRIPLYQRPYAWETEQVEVLLKDLYLAFKNQTKNQTKDYYIGILSVAQTIDDDLRYDLIDGQQRITTLVLIGKAASNYYPEWEKFLNDRLDLYGREGDKAFLKRNGDYLENREKPEPNRKMKNTLQNAMDFFAEKQTEAVEFSKFIYEKAAFFLAEVPHNYSIMDKNRQFVRMNNRGKQLEKHEILKVKLLNSEIINDETKRSEYFKIWNEMISYLTGSGFNSDSTKLTLGNILEEKPDGKGSDGNNDKEIRFFEDSCGAEVRHVSFKCI